MYNGMLSSQCNCSLWTLIPMLVPDCKALSDVFMSKKEKASSKLQLFQDVFITCNHWTFVVN